MNVSTTSALAVAAGDTLITYPSDARATVLVTLVLMIGVFQVILGLLRLGWLTRFIPFSVMTGFMTGVAVMIIIGQLGDFTGYYSHYSGKIAQVADLLLNRDDYMATLAIGSVDDRAGLWAGKNTLLQVFPGSRPRAGFRCGRPAEGVFCDNIKLVGDIADVPRALPNLVLPDLTLIFADRSGDCYWHYRPGAGRRRQPDLPEPGWEIFGCLP